jgi:hypothetical protein
VIPDFLAKCMSFLFSGVYYDKNDRHQPPGCALVLLVLTAAAIVGIGALVGIPTHIV